MVDLRLKYVVRRSSGFFFQAKAWMRAVGIESEALGKAMTGAAAARAKQLADWADAIRKEKKAGRPAPYPPGTFGHWTADLQTRAEWGDKKKRTREEITRALGLLLPVFGPSPLAALERPEGVKAVELFYAGLRKRGSIAWSANVMKWFRYFLNAAVNRGLMARNPARAFEVKQPKARKQRWPVGYVFRTVRSAWRNGDYGVAIAVVLLYDAGWRSGDVRLIPPRVIKTNGEVEIDEQSKTSDGAGTVIGRASLRLIARYKRKIGATVTLHPDAPLIRKPNGKPYEGHEYLSKRIRKAMDRAGVPKGIQARDLRRTANLERAEAGATEAEQGAAGGWNIGRSPIILNTYTPRTLALAKSAQEKRRAAKKRKTA